MVASGPSSNYDEADFNHGLLEGLDLRANGGYVVAPPSQHPNKTLYSVEKDVPRASIPDWLIELMETKGGASSHKRENLHLSTVEILAVRGRSAIS